MYEIEPISTEPGGRSAADARIRSSTYHKYGTLEGYCTTFGFEISVLLVEAPGALDCAPVEAWPKSGDHPLRSDAFCETRVSRTSAVREAKEAKPHRKLMDNHKKYLVAKKNDRLLQRRLIIIESGLQ